MVSIQHTTEQQGHGLRAKLDQFFAGLGQGLNMYVESRARMPEIHRLDAMSDAQLAELGLKREDIVRHVFRDLLYI